MADGGPVTRSQSAQSRSQSTFDSLAKQEDEGKTDAQQDKELSVPNEPGHLTGQAGCIDNAVLLDAVQSLGRAVGGYSERVHEVEAKLEKLARPLNAPVSAEPSVSGGATGPATDPTSDERGDLRPSDAPGQHLTGCAGLATAPRQFAKPGEFDGSGSWSSFIAQFNAISSAQKWSETDKLAILVASLKGPARDLFAHLPGADRLDFHRVSNALEGRFGVLNQEHLFRSQLRRRRRNAGETLPLLAQDIERLVSVAYPAASMELRDSLCCDHFLDALNDAELYIAVRQGRPSSLPQALAAAVEIESVRGAVGLTLQSSSPGVTIRQVQTPGRFVSPDDRARGESVVPTEVLTKILHTLNELRKSLVESGRSSNSKRSSAGGSRSPGTCWECGKEGHFRRQCPRLRNQTSGGESGRRQGNEQ